MRPKLRSMMMKPLFSFTSLSLFIMLHPLGDFSVDITHFLAFVSSMFCFLSNCELFLEPQTQTSNSLKDTSNLIIPEAPQTKGYKMATLSPSHFFLLGWRHSPLPPTSQLSWKFRKYSTDSFFIRKQEPNSVTLPLCIFYLSSPFLLIMLYFASLPRTGKAVSLIGILIARFGT